MNKTTLVPADGVIIMKDDTGEGENRVISVADEKGLVGIAVAVSDEPFTFNFGGKLSTKVKVGDKIVVERHSVQHFHHERTLYKLVRFDAVLAIIKESNE